MLMNKDVSCANFIGLLGYLQEHYGDDGIRQVFSGLVNNKRYLVADNKNPSRLIPIQKHHLTDSAYWVSYGFSVVLFANVRSVVGGSSSLIKAGEKAAVGHFTKSSFFVSRIFSTKYVCKQAAKLNARFNRTKEVKLSELTDNSSTFELRYRPNFRPTKDICNWNLGIYTGIAKITGAADVKCEETKCIVDGDEYCVFQMTWKKKPNLFKRMLRWVLKIISKDLVVDYEVAVQDRDQLIGNLIQSEERYRALTDQSLTGIFIHHDGVIAYVNDCLSTLLNYSKKEMIGKKFWDFVHPEDRKMVEEREMARASGVNHATNYEFRALQKNGELLWLETFATIINYNGQKACMGNVINLTSKKLAEEALGESEDKYRTVLESIEDGYFEVDMNGYFTFFNSSMCNILGYSKYELIGMQHRQVMDAGTAEKIYQALKEIYQSGKTTKTINLELIRKDDSKVFVESLASLIRDSNNQAIGFRGIARDVTERKLAEKLRKELETQLLQAHKMKSVGTLAGGIAHDFNNLLMGIQGHASLMLMDKDSTSPDFENLKGIEEYVQNAAALTKQLLGFVRGGKYEVKPTDLNDLVKRQNRMFGRTRKEITISGKYEQNLWAIEVDQRQIEQVLLNLYVNAWQSMPGGGNIYIQTENVSLDEHYTKLFEMKPGKYVKLSVTDNGVGMDKATQQRIFDPFYTTKTMGRGTGLGLASVYGIVKNHGGFINVYSEKGRGTTFTIHLPVTEKEIIAKKEIEKDILKGSETVLLVDDEEMIIDVGKRLLEKLGYKVLIAGSGNEALEIYNKNRDKIDMVILDMIMPKMDGGETYDMLKKINPKIKVLLSSGYSINGQATEILARGCDGFIQKPFNIRELSEKLREILDKE
ncbi:MAG: PAS domain S-box protein [Desulfobacterales bacterium]|uniref:histidine kinase n=1 Tax=Candidatus Desulfatibia vada TaxID=2841696 RepID=A0A8J6NSS2_9BACT|nr:PAS domain S-box protein [Candidatus Desulfatibia vada]